MFLERDGGGLKIIEGDTEFVFALPESDRPLEELLIRAALAVVSSAKPSDGKARAQEILSQGQSADQLTLAMRVCTEFLRG